ncbi:hypothetical protein UA32_12480 [Photobacterium angustum]|uniref:HAD domain-containing protein n=1 Tax=Photobacterium angustum TaxID=661 RepID=UPI0005E692DD|nr:HAD domain-containing protein [Photobacterium angustum]KJG37763.1 hypothetical protein UA32_12480 [Photobacterium angustum]
MFTLSLFIACIVGLYFIVKNKEKTESGPSRPFDDLETKAVKQELTFPISESNTIDQLVRKGFNHRKPTVFFDVDGVLHPNYDESLSNLPILLNILNKNPNVQFIMSSSWRVDVDDNYLVNRFGIPFNLALVGATPYGMKSRSDEITTFIKYYKIKKYIILDDRKDLFHKKMDNIIFTDTNKGLTKKHEKNDF